LSQSAHQLKAKEKGIISHFSNKEFTGRFLSLGIEPGSEIVIEKIAFFNGTRVVSIDGNKFAMRKVELQMIVLK